LIPSASVTLENKQTGLLLQTRTESAGAYTFRLVPPGPGYQIKFEAEGFTPVVVSDLYLNIGDTRTQNASLRPGGTAVTVAVSAATQDVTINVADAPVGNNVEVGTLNELPVANRDSPTALFYM
jgi:hypothetical protein